MNTTTIHLALAIAAGVLIGLAAKGFIDARQSALTVAA